MKKAPLDKPVEALIGALQVCAEQLYSPNDIPLIIVGPRSNNLQPLDIVENLIDEPMLDIYSPQVRA